MPFGLALAPAIFQRATTYPLFKSIKDKVVVYLDDISIATNTLKENKQLLSEIIIKLVSNGLYRNCKKWEIFKNTIQFIGFDIDSKRTSVPFSYTTKLENCTEPKNIKDCQRFLGLINFVHNYLPHIQKKGTAFYNYLKIDPKRLKWTDEYSTLFYDIFFIFNTVKKLAHPNFTYHLAMTTDANHTHIGGSLYQTQNIKNRQHIDDKLNNMGLFKPLGFFTKTLTTTQINYSKVD
jgi:Reverse transcriptase (RNA-dependent DNA polymerase)